MVYNAHTVMKEFWSYDELYQMPIRDVLDQLNYFMPKMKEIARRQEAERLKLELTNKNGMKKPGGGRRM